jgi:hypothetical protein
VVDPHVPLIPIAANAANEVAEISGLDANFSDANALERI